MKLKAMALGLVWTGALTSPAWAECSQERFQIIANRYFALTDKSLDPEPISKGVLEDAAVCANDAYALKIATMAQIEAATQTQANREVALGHAGEAFRLYQAMIRAMPEKTERRSVVGPNASVVPVDLNNTYDVSKAALNALLTLEAATGKTSKFSPGPPKPDDPAITCSVYASSLAQQAAFWMGDKGDSSTGWNILNGIIANCTGNDFNRASARGNRAGLYLKRLRADPAAPGAMDLVRLAYADHEAIVAFRSTGVSMTWDQSQMDELARLSFKAIVAAKASLPTDQWFTVENLKKPLTRAYIAAALDAAYARDLAEANGGVTAYRQYRGVLTPAFNAAKALPEPQATEARKLLYLAARDHAENRMRAPENAGLKKPHDWLYNWIDPDYKPPATPAPAPAAPATAQ